MKSTHLVRGALGAIVLAASFGALAQSSSTDPSSTDTNAMSNGRPDRSVGRYVDDKAITTKIKGSYVADKVVRARDIHVKTIDGNVNLSGWARSQAEVDRAVEIAQETSGVKDVKNDIQMRATQ